MYCSISRSRFYNTKDYLAAWDEKNGSKGRSDSVANIKVEREDKYIITTTPITIGETTFLALIDSGAQNTFVTQRICKERRIE
ncbi:hypothetical protein ENBRE01_3148 [Enteropsectra breve]|nr:hypothetical protein ENBRE01_3148 [Enteropsectra breve]